MSSRKRQSLIKTLDRLSDLPDDMIHHIFSFLGANDLLSLSILSRRFRQLCILNPYLSFSFDYKLPKFKKCTIKNKGFRSYLNDFLRLRDGAKVHRFNLEWVCRETIDENENMLNTWIHDAVRCQVEELHLVIDLEFPKKKPYVLPECIFDCPSLRDLKISLGNYSYYNIFPGANFLKSPSKDFSSLQVLSLGCCRVNDDYIGDWISTHCKSLKKLTLYCIYGMRKLSITSSSLEDLSISWCFHELHCLTVFAEKLHTLSMNANVVLDFREKSIPMNIVAPNLRTFTWIGRLPVKFIGCFKAIQNASIYDICNNKWSEEDSLTILVRILESVSQARVLQLHIYVLKYIIKRGGLPITFEKVDHLVVVVRSLWDCQTSSIASFVRRLPNLRTLSIKCQIKFDKCAEASKEICDQDLMESMGSLKITFSTLEMEVDNELEQKIIK